jgi:ADP-glucose pyrophosphorylase
MAKRTRTNTLQNHINDITDDKSIKRPLNTLFIMLKHRKQWFDRKLQSDTITQLTKFLSQFKPEQVIVIYCDNI